MEDVAAPADASDAAAAAPVFDRCLAAGAAYKESGYAAIKAGDWQRAFGQDVRVHELAATVLARDSRNAKALFRRGQALPQLQNGGGSGAVEAAGCLFDALGSRSPHCAAPEGEAQEEERAICLPVSVHNESLIACLHSNSLPLVACCFLLRSAHDERSFLLRHN
jgi:hypothetical protein